MRSFQLARGYQPSVFGIPSSVVPQELSDSHVEQTATRALQKFMHSNAARSLPQYAYKKGEHVWVWYQSSKGKKKHEWIPGIIKQTHDHYLEVQRVKDGKPTNGNVMKPAYEDTRLAQSNSLFRELLSCSLEDQLQESVNWREVCTDHDAVGHSRNINALISSRLVPKKSIGMLDVGTDNPERPNGDYHTLQRFENNETSQKMSHNRA